MSRGRYTVNEVEYRTKVPASTLRQWERRYGFPKPERSGAGYRLYCDGDIRSIELMKRHIAEGVSASKAAELVCQKEPAAVLPSSLEGLRRVLLAALLQFSEAKADKVLSQAHGFHDVETVLTELLERTAIKLGALRHQGEIPVTSERFASAYLQGRLWTLLSATANPEEGEVVIVACAPLEQRELGALMLAVLLRRAGYRTLYLGADTPIRELRELADRLRPVGVMITASSAESVARLTAARGYLEGVAPVLAFGGAAFNRQPELAEELAGAFLAADAGSVVRRFDELVQGAMRA